MRKSLCCICLFFSGILTLAAQSGSGGDAKREAGRLAWFACTSIPEGLENPVKVMLGKDITELELPRYMTSASVKIPADGAIRIVREVPDPKDPAKTKYLVLAEAKIPDAVRQALIILVPQPKLKGDLIFQAKVQDLANFKGGDRLFINMSDTNIGVQIGDTKLALPARQAKIYQAPALTKPTNMPLMYSFYHPVEKKWKLLSASTIVLRPPRRKICIFNNGSRLGNIENHGILFPVQMGTR